MELRLQLQHAERFSTWKLHDPIVRDLGDPRCRGHRMTAADPPRSPRSSSRRSPTGIDPRINSRA
jgi:hypothetical protein